MSEDPDHILRPVIEPVPNKRPRINAARFVRDFCIFFALIAIGISTWFFLGFVENDLGFLHLLSAFIMSFGCGGLVFVPLFWIALMAHRPRGSARKSAAIVFALILPWPIIAFLFTQLGGIWIIVGLALILTALICLSWAVRLWKAGQLQSKD